MIATVAGGVLLFTRIASLLMLLPGVSARVVPRLARMAVALPLTLLLLPGVGQPVVPTDVSVLFGQIAGEAVLGSAMGFCVSMVFSALSTAADIISAQGGLQMAAMLDPLTMSQPGAAGVLVTWLGTGVFFGENLHLRCIEALGASMQAMPLGHAASAFAAGQILLPLGGVALYTGVQLAGPLIALIFCVNLGISILGRMAPGLQLFFAVGPTFTLAAALALLAVTLPALLGAWYGALPAGFDAVRAILRAAG